MQLQSLSSTQNAASFDVWLLNMIDNVENAAASTELSDSLKRYKLQTAEMVRQRVAMRMWEEGSAGRRYVPLLRRLNAAISRMRYSAAQH